MTICIKVGNVADEVGSSDFFHSFFSTICGNLENASWGSKYPIMMNKLYQGKLNSSESKDALNELKAIQTLLAKLNPEKVIWDIETPAKQPPWGYAIAAEITNLSNYYVTSTGRDLISTLLEALEDSANSGKPLEIVQV